jgi:hypothetical protein
MNRSASPRQSVLLGIARIARGRADGVGCFGGTPQSFMASLAPLIAFPLVGAGMALFTDGPRRALTGLAVAICALLTPAVISYELARIWRRAESWLRFATAFNWCEWILPFVACLVMVPLSVAINAGMREAVASSALVACLVAYGLWLHWFLARKALELSGGRAALLVLLVNLGTAVTVFGPHLLAKRIA